jgi:hypothetical protein
MVVDAETSYMFRTGGMSLELFTALTSGPSLSDLHKENISYDRFMRLQKQIASVMAVSSPDSGRITRDGTLILTYNGGEK